jgi:hypothetical protein
VAQVVLEEVGVPTEIQATQALQEILVVTVIGLVVVAVMVVEVVPVVVPQVYIYTKQDKM